MLFKGKTICITGGTGSLGKALVDRLIETECKRIIILSRDEYKQHLMRKEYSQENRIRYFLGNIRDKDRLFRAFDGVDYLIHAAALKQADIIDYNYQEAVKTNINGTQNVIDAAIDCGVKHVVFISSDKAVEPINFYGATKQIGEQLIKTGNIYSSGNTVFSIFRSGNFINSRGSFTEMLWRMKYAGVKEVPIIHTNMYRYWINLEEASKNVLDVFLFNKPQIVVPTMYKAKITDIARMIIPDCVFVPFSRYGNEKLDEKLWQIDECQFDRQYTKEMPKGYLYAYKPLETNIQRM